MLDRPLADPWTPTANLKMLISVASPEIRDREKKKELFRPIENEPEDIEPDAQQVLQKTTFLSYCIQLVCADSR